jgi:hypothetical protein
MASTGLIITAVVLVLILIALAVWYLRWPIEYPLSGLSYGLAGAGPLAIQTKRPLDPSYVGGTATVTIAATASSINAGAVYHAFGEGYQAKITAIASTALGSALALYPPPAVLGAMDPFVLGITAGTLTVDPPSCDCQCSLLTVPVAQIWLNITPVSLLTFVVAKGALDSSAVGKTIIGVFQTTNMKPMKDAKGNDVISAYDVMMVKAALNPYGGKITSVELAGSSTLVHVTTPNAIAYFARADQITVSSGAITVWMESTPCACCEPVLHS